MAKAEIISEKILKDLADAIREKDGTTDLIKPVDMPSKIENMSGGNPSLVNYEYIVPTELDTFNNGGRGFEIYCCPDDFNIVLAFSQDDISMEHPYMYIYSSDSVFPPMEKTGEITIQIPYPNLDTISSNFDSIIVDAYGDSHDLSSVSELANCLDENNEPIASGYWEIKTGDMHSYWDNTSVVNAWFGDLDHIKVNFVDLDGNPVCEYYITPEKVYIMVE